MSSQVYPTRFVWQPMLIIVCIVTTLSCATTQEPSPVSTRKIVAPASIQAGTPELMADPLPDYIPYTTELPPEGKDAVATRQIVAHGWDFNGDGAADFVEYLNAAGQPATCGYDFDFDGTMDVQKTCH